MKSIGVILEIGDDFLHMREDPLFQEVIDTIDEVKDLDMDILDIFYSNEYEGFIMTSCDL